jgi:hypothetical protein
MEKGLGCRICVSCRAWPSPVSGLTARSRQEESGAEERGWEGFGIVKSMNNWLGLSSRTVVFSCQAGDAVKGGCVVVFDLMLMLRLWSKNQIEV